MVLLSDIKKLAGKFIKNPIKTAVVSYLIMKILKDNKESYRGESMKFKEYAYKGYDIVPIKSMDEDWISVYKDDKKIKIFKTEEDAKKWVDSQSESCKEKIKSLKEKYCFKEYSLNLKEALSEYEARRRWNSASRAAKEKLFDAIGEDYSYINKDFDSLPKDLKDWIIKGEWTGKENFKEYDWNTITKQEFEKYEAVRSSGVTNMWDVNRVQSLSGLSRDKIMAIMSNYGDLNKKYPGVRKETCKEKLTRLSKGGKR